jgi:preprotein translocase subunit Sec63
MTPYYFTNTYPLSSNRNIDFIGSPMTNPYSLIQQGGKTKRKRRSKRKSKKRRRNKN